MTEPEPDPGMGDLHLANGVLLQGLCGYHGDFARAEADQDPPSYQCRQQFDKDLDHCFSQDASGQD